MCRFERLKLQCLAEPISGKYAEVMGKFSSEIDRIQKVTPPTAYTYMYVISSCLHVTNVEISQLYSFHILFYCYPRTLLILHVHVHLIPHYLLPPQLYQEQRKSPPLGYNMPPMSGKIAWSRQLVRHLEEPMEVLKERDALLHSAQGKAVVRKYNKMALALTEYEILHYQAWVQVLEVGQKNLQVLYYTQAEDKDFSCAT